MQKEFVKGELVCYVRNLATEANEVFLVPIGDAHFGSPLFSLRHFDRALNLLNEPNCYAVLTGDLCDTTVRDSLGDIYKQVKSPQDQRDWMIERLYPFKDKILGMVNGNHERRIYNRTSIDISKDIAEALEIPYRDEGMLIRIRFGKNNESHGDRPYTFEIYMTHGYGGARTDGARLAKGERMATHVKADVYIQSHDHKVIVTPTVYLEADIRTHKEGEFEVSKVIAKSAMIVKTSSFLKWGGYSESGGFSPVNLEPPIIKFWGDVTRKGIKVEVSSG